MLPANTKNSRSKSAPNPDKWYTTSTDFTGTTRQCPPSLGGHWRLHWGEFTVQLSVQRFVMTCFQLTQYSPDGDTKDTINALSASLKKRLNTWSYAGMHPDWNSDGNIFAFYRTGWTALVRQPKLSQGVFVKFFRSDVEINFLVPRDR